MQTVADRINHLRPNRTYAKAWPELTGFQVLAPGPDETDYLGTNFLHVNLGTPQFQYDPDNREEAASKLFQSRGALQYEYNFGPLSLSDGSFGDVSRGIIQVMVSEQGRSGGCSDPGPAFVVHPATIFYWPPPPNNCGGTFPYESYFLNSHDNPYTDLYPEADFGVINMGDLEDQIQEYIDTINEGISGDIDPTADDIIRDIANHFNFNPDTGKDI
jgi:hypothetical protein